MALNVELVNVTPNEIVWFVRNEGGEGGFGTSAEISTSDLAAACVDDTWGRAASVRLRQVCRAGLDGLGTVAAGAWTIDLARDLLMCDGRELAGGPLMPRAALSIVHQGGPEIVPRIDVGADAGEPLIAIETEAAEGSFYVKLQLRGTPNI